MAEGRVEISETCDGVLVPVHVAPRASRSQVAGPFGGALKVRLAAPPVDGAANSELVKTLAKFFGIPKSSISIVNGLSSKRKTVKIINLSLASAIEKIDG